MIGKRGMVFSGRWVFRFADFSVKVGHLSQSKLAWTKATLQDTQQGSGIGAAGGSVVLGACCTVLITKAPASNVTIQLTFVALGWLEDVFAGCYSYV